MAIVKHLAMTWVSVSERVLAAPTEISDIEEKEAFHEQLGVVRERHPTAHKNNVESL